MIEISSASSLVVNSSSLALSSSSISKASGVYEE
jgi:hypothetical protein